MASINAVAPESASAAPAAAPSPASTGADGGSVSQADVALTDDKILGIENQAEPSEPSTPAEGAQPSQAAPAAQPQPSELSVEDFKSLFAANPKVQSLWDRYDKAQKTIGLFGTAADTAKVAETIQLLGGPKELESLVAKASDVDQTDAVVFGGTQKDREAWVDNDLYTNDPNEFPQTSQAVAGMIDAGLSVMQRRDPERFAEVRERLAIDAFKQDGFGSYLRNLAQARDSGEGLDKAVDLLLKRYGIDLGFLQDTRRESPEAQRLQQERQRIESQQKSWTEQQEQRSIETVRTKKDELTKSEVEKALSELKGPNGNPVFGGNSSKIRSVISNQIMSKVLADITANPVFIAQANSIAAQGIMGREQALIDLTMRYVKLNLPSVVQSVVGEWTQQVVEHAKGAAQRAQAAASRSDISGAAGGNSRVAKLDKKQIEKMGGYGKVSDDDILNG
jgi:hypothetical protein